MGDRLGKNICKLTRKAQEMQQQMGKDMANKYMKESQPHYWSEKC